MRLTSHRLRGNPPIRGFRWGVPMACSAKSRISSNGADFRRRESLHIMALSEHDHWSAEFWKRFTADIFVNASCNRLRPAMRENYQLRCIRVISNAIRFSPLYRLMLVVFDHPQVGHLSRI